MRRFHNVLIYPSGLNRGDPAISTAVDLARAAGATLTIVWIIAPSVPALDVRQQARTSRLEELTSDLQASGVTARSVLLIGNKPSRLLVELVHKHGIDLVVKTARPGDQPRDRAFSETAKRLLRECPCPVWIVRTRPKGSIARILIAISPYHYEQEREDLDRGVLDVGLQLAGTWQAELHVGSAWEFPVTGQGLPGEQTDDEGAVRQRLDQFLRHNGCAIPDENIHVYKGRAAEAVSRVADEIGAELIVVGAAGRTGIRGWILGNTVEDVLDESTTAVLGVSQDPSESG